MSTKAEDPDVTLLKKARQEKKVKEHITFYPHQGNYYPIAGNKSWYSV